MRVDRIGGEADDSPPQHTYTDPKSGRTLHCNLFAPEGITNTRMEHMMSFDYAYRIEAVRDWLFAQRKP